MVRDRIVREKERRQITGISRATAFRLEKKGEFPRRRHLSPGSVGWLESELLAWVQIRKNGEKDGPDRRQLEPGTAPLQVPMTATEVFSGFAGTLPREAAVTWEDSRLSDLLDDTIRDPWETDRSDGATDGENTLFGVTEVAIDNNPDNGKGGIWRVDGVRHSCLVSGVSTAREAHDKAISVYGVYEWELCRIWFVGEVLPEVFRL